MKRFAWLTIGALAMAATAVAQVGPSTAPATRPARAGVSVRMADGDLVPATGPVAVPYTLSGTNHLVLRLKINGHGPYNFVVDTGAPTMFVDEGIAAQIGLKPDPAPRRRGRAARAAAQPATAPTTRPGWGTIDRLDLEGGLSIAAVKCLILTPYQITGMNAIGVAGMPLHGLLGYSVLARFKLDIDLSKRQMLWTPQGDDFVPPPMRSSGRSGADDPRETQLESMGGLLKVLGPLIKANLPAPAKPRGLVGVSLVATADAVTVDHVLGDGPADRAGVHVGDVLTAVDGKAVKSVADAEHATAHDLPGKSVKLTVRRGPTTRELTVTTGEGL